jgi:hypothetical protein
MPIVHKRRTTILNDLLLGLVNAFDLKKNLVPLVVPLPLRQKGVSSGAENVFRSQPLTVTRKPSGQSTYPSR